MSFRAEALRVYLTRPVGQFTAKPAGGIVPNMDGEPPNISLAPEASARRTTVMRVLTAASLALSCALAVALAIRPISSLDIGYHLAYGEHFLDGGGIVDSNPYVYTLPQPGQRQLPEPGPGCWYDQQGQYRFANANWLSQIIMAAVNRRFGAMGLCALGALLVAGTFGAAIVTMRRLRTPWLAMPPVLILVAMAAYPRFSLRPELFSYLLLSIQFAILVTGRASWASVAALVGIHWLLVNVHSYFPLGLMLTGAFWADRVLRMVWSRWLSGQEAARKGNLKDEVVRRSATLAGQAAVGFVNPWTWRLATLPLETMAFLYRHHIAGGRAAPDGHPWSQIGEFASPFAFGPRAGWDQYAFYVLLFLAVTGGLAAAKRRRWDWLIVIASMSAVSLSMRRNVASAAIIVAPLASGALCGLSVCVRAARAPLGSLWTRMAAACVFILVGAGLLVSVTTQNFYFSARMPWRFGVGLSRLALPLRAAEWINRHQPQGRLWTDYSSSSNFHYFTEPHRAVPILTNTWAYPPQVMQTVLDYNRGRLEFEQARREHGVEIVAFSATRWTAVPQQPGLSPLLQTLAHDPKWRLVCLDGTHVVYLRVEGPNADLARRSAITERDMDVGEYIDRLERADPVAAQSTYLAGWTLFHMDWHQSAAALFDAAVQRRPNYYEAWNMLGLSLVHVGRQQLDRGNAVDGLRTWRRAGECFERALYIEGDYSAARQNLSALEAEMRSRGLGSRP